MQTRLFGSDENASGPKARQVYTVSEINAISHETLRESIGSVWVSGEISGYRPHASGHFYFSLKDQKSRISAVLFAGSARKLRCELKDGLEVVAYGEISLYAPQGSYQIVLSKVEPKGLGELQLAFEQLKEKLGKEGLFEESRKRPLPFMPSAIGLVTSRDGAAIKDILNGIDMRFPNSHVIIYPVRVQGQGSEDDIAEGIRYFSSSEEVEVMIVGRGGGSIEDLWAFNTETVARAVADSKIPVVSAVGHEVDYLISDFVADARAQTPTYAATLVVPDKEELSSRLDELKESLADSLIDTAEGLRADLEMLRARLEQQDPRKVIAQRMQTLDGQFDLLNSRASRFFEAFKTRIEHLGARLEGINPLSILSRGYSLTLKDGEIVSSATQVSPGDQISTRLAKGTIVSKVVSKTE